MLPYTIHKFFTFLFVNLSAATEYCIKYQSRIIQREGGVEGSIYFKKGNPMILYLLEVRSLDTLCTKDCLIFEHPEKYFSI